MRITEKKCQICGTLENVQIHHQNYNDYLKINLLCKKHHFDIHNNLINCPRLIDLEKNSIKNPHRSYLTNTNGIKRTELIQIKITPTEKKILKKNADKLGVTISDFIRFNCLGKEEN